jgi:hypothetical protein
MAKPVFPRFMKSADFGPYYMDWALKSYNVRPGSSRILEGGLESVSKHALMTSPSHPHRVPKNFQSCLFGVGVGGGGGFRQVCVVQFVFISLLFDKFDIEV